MDRFGSILAKLVLNQYLAKGNQELSRLRKSSLPSLPLPNSHWKEGLYHKEKYYQR